MYGHKYALITEIIDHRSLPMYVVCSPILTKLFIHPSEIKLI